ncbi:hypothetical protein SAMN05421753_113126 [Planctomicrobium piriforme]|uniref:Uncharacterized protein n=2 Tax=Planctomicrobium piriforme TaxID=1576369 RepID=A0A1I3M0W0_9PLAN|nr:hypothetical protein SAMN05421753_113126 [Planctomicrobium piriforme]
MLMGQKYRVHRDVIIAHVLRESGIDLNGIGTESALVQAVLILDKVKAAGLGDGGGRVVD